MKKFFGEFKKFIMRGNVLDMAVGVIVGGAFTAIVNGLSNNVLKPIINYLLALILGKNALTEVYTFLGPKAYLEDGTLDLANCFYIDWGAFINAIINFLLVAIVLFLIIKVMNKVAEGKKKFVENMKGDALTKEDRKILKKRGIKLIDFDAVEAYKKEKQANIEKELEIAKLKKAEEDRIAKENSTEYILKEIRDLLKAKSE